MVTLAAVYCAFDIDLFDHQGGTTLKEAEIELVEALRIGALLALTLLGFRARHYFARKREMAGRIAAERDASLSGCFDRAAEPSPVR